MLHEMKGLDARYNFHADGAVVRLTSEAAQLLQSRSSLPHRARNRQLMRCSELSGQIGAVEAPARRSAELTTSVGCSDKTGGIRFERLQQDQSC